MPMRPVEMERLLKKNGFIFIRQTGSHRIFYNPETQRQTIVPAHAKELRKGTEQKILKQAGLK